MLFVTTFPVPPPLPPPPTVTIMSEELQLSVECKHRIANYVEPSEEVPNDRDTKLIVKFDQWQSVHAWILMKNRLAMRFSLEAHHIWKIVAVLFDGTAKEVKTAEDVAHLTENDRLVVFVDTNIPVLPGNT